MSQIIITSRRLKLRNWKDEDTEPFIKMNMDTDVMRFFPAPQTREETLAQILRIKQHFDDHGYGLYAVERKDNGLFIGFTGFAHPRFESHFTPCIEIGWRLSKENWRQGFATEAAKACLDHGFKRLGFDEILSFTATTNIPSIGVMEKVGLTRVEVFEHPLLPNGHKLKPHVLYKVVKKNIPL